MAKRGQKQRTYDLKFKEMIINERIHKGKSVAYLSKEYDIPQGTIETWVYKFKHTGILKAKQRGRPKSDPNQDWKEKYEILKKYLEFLEEVDQEKK